MKRSKNFKFLLNMGVVMLALSAVLTFVTGKYVAFECLRDKTDPGKVSCTLKDAFLGFNFLKNNFKFDKPSKAEYIAEKCNPNDESVTKQDCHRIYVSDNKKEKILFLDERIALNNKYMVRFTDTLNFFFFGSEKTRIVDSNFKALLFYFQMFLAFLGVVYLVNAVSVKLSCDDSEE